MTTRFLNLDERNTEVRELLDSDREAAMEFKRRYEMSWYYHENALEGIVLTEHELVQALEHQVVGDASLMSVLTVIRNHRAAHERIEQEAKGRRVRLTAGFLVELFEILVAGTNPSAKVKAMWRKEMPLHRTYFHDIAQPAKIEAELEKALKFTVSAEFKEFHPLKQAAHVHWSLMQVYPFADHNGKIARLIQSLYLIRAGYMPAIIHGVERQRYYESLKAGSSAVRNLLLESIENSLENTLQVFQAMGNQAMAR